MFGVYLGYGLSFYSHEPVGALLQSGPLGPYHCYRSLVDGKYYILKSYASKSVVSVSMAELYPQRDTLLREINADAALRDFLMAKAKPTGNVQLDIFVLDRAFHQQE